MRNPAEILIAIAPQLEPDGTPVIFAAYPRFLSAPSGFAVRIALLPLDAARACAICERADGILIPGGDDIDPALYGQRPLPQTDAPLPARDALETAVIKKAVASGTPLLGICRGAQMLNVVLGGSLIQDIPTLLPGALAHSHAGQGAAAIAYHGVKPVAGTPLCDVFAEGGADVASVHHQAMDPGPSDLRAAALAPDGVVEAVCLPNHPFALGVQWHPELQPGSPASLRLASIFLRACGAHAKERAGSVGRD